MTHKRDDDGCEHVAALVPFYFVGKDAPPGYETKCGPAIPMDYADEAERKLFLEALLKLKWLPDGVRRAVTTALDRSLRRQNAAIERARTITLRHMIDEAKARIRANGERPYGGIRTAAI